VVFLAKEECDPRMFFLALKDEYRHMNLFSWIVIEECKLKEWHVDLNGSLYEVSCRKFIFGASYWIECGKVSSETWSSWWVESWLAWWVESWSTRWVEFWSSCLSVETLSIESWWSSRVEPWSSCSNLQLPCVLTSSSSILIWLLNSYFSWDQTSQTNWPKTL
jgi:hypothetical protein